MINNKTHIKTIVGLVEKIAKKESEKVQKYNLNTGKTVATIGRWTNLNNSTFTLGINLKNGEISSCNKDEFLNCDIASITLNENWKERIKQTQENIKKGHDINYNEGVVTITELVEFLYGSE